MENMKKRLLYCLTTVLALLLGGGLALAQRQVGDVLEVGDIRYKITKAAPDGEVEVRSKDPKYSGDIVIPEKVKETVGAVEYEYTVTGIGDRAFYGSGLTSISIPASVTRIGVQTFRGCARLKSIALPPRISHIGESAFLHCKNLGGEIKLPATLTKIERAAFAGCRKITRLDVDPANPNYESVDGVLYNKGRTVLMRRPGGLKSTKLIIPNTVNTIAWGGCGDSDGLESVTIPASVTTIEQHAFSAAPKLKFVYVLPKVPPACQHPIVTRELTKFYVPGAKYADYIAANGWKDHKDKIVRSYTVTLDASNGEPPVTRVLVHDEKVELPTQPSKAGFTFIGWRKDGGDPEGLFDFTKERVRNDLIIRAVWGFKVTFKDGANTNEVEIEESTSVTPPNSPEKPGHLFMGWRQDGAADGLFNFTTEKVTKNLILNAVWGHSVTFDTDGGTPQVDAQTVEHGKKASPPPALSKKDHTFKEWQKDGAKFDLATEAVTENLTLKALWEPNAPKAKTFTVTFRVDGAVKGTKTVDQNASIAALTPAPEKPGHTLMGWRQDGVADGLFDFTTEKVTKNLTLNAVWGHSVTFNTDGGTPEIAQQTVEHGKKLSPPTPPSKKDHTFKEWQKDGAKFDLATEAVNENLTLKALWEPNAPKAKTFTVTFRVDGAVKGTKTVDQNASVAALTPAPEKPGHTLMGWRQDGAADGLFDFTTEKVTKNLSLKAVWGHTVSFNTDGGMPQVDAQTVEHGKHATPPPALTKKDHTFKEWQKDGAKFDLATEAVNENLTLKALWEPENKGPVDPGKPTPTPPTPGNPPATPGNPPAKPGNPPAKPNDPPTKPGNPPAKPSDPPAKPGNPQLAPGPQKPGALITPVELVAAPELRIAPVPASDFLMLQGAGERTTVRIYSLRGQLMLVESLAPGATLNLRRLPAGAYLLRAEGQTVGFVKR
ncbi:MAG: hypothetical protein CSA07_04790 [Bacteroidia bacterium]|nr:MAG: hypothetical protein CSA07_04790 [Bacteroidia bacterium]